MLKVIESVIPSESLVMKYLKDGAFVDCYCLDIQKAVTLECYIEAFYTTTVFKIERTLLSVATFKFASDNDAASLAEGSSDKYSIWSVERRDPNQVVLCEFTKSTRSWLMVESSRADEGKTRLYFGSVVIPREVSETGEPTFSFVFHLLGYFHKLYSKALLGAAHRKLMR
ncbi:hypothetical protein EOL70_17145 [Leucothrix sargassi]|nr:hypothetical protein EOL70_17145 [Leucothrix sargassi]